MKQLLFLISFVLVIINETAANVTGNRFPQLGHPKVLKNDDEINEAIMRLSKDLAKCKKQGDLNVAEYASLYFEVNIEESSPDIFSLLITAGRLEPIKRLFKCGYNWLFSSTIKLVHFVTIAALQNKFEIFKFMVDNIKQSDRWLIASFTEMGVNIVHFCFYSKRYEFLSYLVQKNLVTMEFIESLNSKTEMDAELFAGWYEFINKTKFLKKLKDNMKQTKFHMVEFVTPVFGSGEDDDELVYEIIAMTDSLKEIYQDGSVEELESVIESFANIDEFHRGKYCLGHLMDFPNRFFEFYPIIKKHHDLKAEHLIMSIDNNSFMNLGSSILQSSSDKKYEIFEQIVSDFPEILSFLDPTKRTLIHILALSKDINGLKIALKYLKKDHYFLVQQPTMYGSTLMEKLISYGNEYTEIVKLLIESELFPLEFRLSSTYNVAQTLLLYNSHELILTLDEKSLKNALKQSSPFLHSPLILLAANSDNANETVFNYIVNLIPESLEMENVFGDNLKSFVERYDDLSFWTSFLNQRESTILENLEQELINEFSLEKKENKNNSKSKKGKKLSKIINKVSKVFEKPKIDKVEINLQGDTLTNPIQPRVLNSIQTQSQTTQTLQVESPVQSPTNQNQNDAPFIKVERRKKDKYKRMAIIGDNIFKNGESSQPERNDSIEIPMESFMHKSGVIKKKSSNNAFKSIQQVTDKSLFEEKSINDINRKNEGAKEEKEEKEEVEEHEELQIEQNENGKGKETQLAQPTPILPKSQLINQEANDSSISTCSNVTLFHPRPISAGICSDLLSSCISIEDYISDDRSTYYSLSAYESNPQFDATLDSAINDNSLKYHVLPTKEFDTCDDIVHFYSDFEQNKLDDKIPSAFISCSEDCVADNNERMQMLRDTQSDSDLLSLKDKDISVNETDALLELNNYLDHFDKHKFNNLELLLRSVLINANDLTEKSKIYFNLLSFADSLSSIYKLVKTFLSVALKLTSIIQVQTIIHSVINHFIFPYFKEQNECDILDCEKRLLNTFHALTAIKSHNFLSKLSLMPALSEYIYYFKDNMSLRMETLLVIKSSLFDLMEQPQRQQINDELIENGYL